jgi:hypothetical protein
MPDLLRQSPTVIIATCGGPIRRPDRVFAMSRDGRFPVHRLRRRVSPRTQTPVPATVLILAVGVVLMVALPGAALLKLITASTILPAIIYGATVVLCPHGAPSVGPHEGRL